MSPQLSLCHLNSRCVTPTLAMSSQLTPSHYLYLSHYLIFNSRYLAPSLVISHSCQLTLSPSPTLAMSTQLSLCHPNFRYVTSTHTIILSLSIALSDLQLSSSHTHILVISHSPINSPLTDNNKMKLYKFKTMTYGKHSIKYVAGILWNNINLDIKNTDNVFFFF